MPYDKSYPLPSNRRDDLASSPSTVHDPLGSDVISQVSDDDFDEYFLEFEDAPSDQDLVSTTVMREAMDFIATTDFVILEPSKAPYCFKCKLVIKPSHLDRHLRDRHTRDMSVSGRKELIAALKTLGVPDDLGPYEKATRQVLDAIPELEVNNGFGCNIGECAYFCAAQDTIYKHTKDVHGLHFKAGMDKVTYNANYFECFVQRLDGSSHFPYYRVDAPVSYGTIRNYDTAAQLRQAQSTENVHVATQPPPQATQGMTQLNEDISALFISALDSARQTASRMDQNARQQSIYVRELGLEEFFSKWFGQGNTLDKHQRQRLLHTTNLDDRHIPTGAAAKQLDTLTDFMFYILHDELLPATDYALRQQVVYIPFHPTLSRDAFSDQGLQQLEQEQSVKSYCKVMKQLVAMLARAGTCATFNDWSPFLGCNMFQHNSDMQRTVAQLQQQLQNVDCDDTDAICHPSNVQLFSTLLYQLYECNIDPATLNPLICFFHISTIDWDGDGYISYTEISNRSVRLLYWGRLFILMLISVQGMSSEAVNRFIVPGQNQEVPGQGQGEHGQDQEVPGQDQEQHINDYFDDDDEYPVCG